jgi:hypothetical protein
MNWHVVLADGRAVSPGDCDPQDVPRHPRVACIAQDDGVLVNGDWFVHRVDLDRWMEHSDVGVLLELIDHAHEIDAVRAGKFLDKQAFKKLWAQARELVDG